MSKNYAAGYPVGNNQMPVGALTPAPFKAIATYISENATASSVISFTHNTTAIEVATQGTAAIIRWITTGDTEASVFANASIMTADHMIPPNSVRRFVVPIESNPASATSVQGANRADGLFQRVAWKSQGIASVLLTEYGSSNSY